MAEQAADWVSSQGGDHHGREVRRTFLEAGGLTDVLLRGVVKPDLISSFVTQVLVALASAREPTDLPEDMRGLFGLDPGALQTYLTLALSAGVDGRARGEAVSGFTMNPIAAAAKKHGLFGLGKKKQVAE